MIIQFPHAFTRKPKTDSAGFLPTRFKASEKTRKYSGGMYSSRIFQLDTAVVPTPASSAAAFWPPTASITSDTVLSIPPYKTRSVDCQAVHNMVIENKRSVACYASMDNNKMIGERLRSLRKHFGNGRESQELFARRFGVEKTAWSNYETGVRPVPVELADRFCRDLGISMDWLYRGNGVAMPISLLQALQTPIRKRA